LVGSTTGNKVLKNVISSRKKAQTVRQFFFGFCRLLKLGSLDQLWARAKHNLSGLLVSVIDKTGRNIIDPVLHAMS
jgi:hypothetical protein